MTRLVPYRRVLFVCLCLPSTACSSSDPAPQGALPVSEAGPEDAFTIDAGADNTPLADTNVEEGSTPAESGTDSTDAPSCTPVHPSPPMGPSGFALDGWTWTRRGVVLEDTQATAQGGYIAPAAVVVGDTLHLWITRKQGTTHRILHSSSTDGVSFSAPESTVGLGDDDIIAYPSVVRDGSRLLMWYGSGTIDHAQSQDGVTWTTVATAVLKPEQGAFDSLSLLYPNVTRTASGYVMYYTGYNGAEFAIGRAESPDGAVWTRLSPTPVLAKGDATSFDNHAVAQGCAVATTGGTLLWYGGYDTSQANPGPYRIGLATTQDGTTLVRKGVTLDLTPSGEEAWSTRDPAVVAWKGGWWMGYAVMGDDAKYRFAVATSETCGTL